MLEFIRNNPKVVQATLIIFVLPPFLLGGIEGLNWINRGGAEVASVNGNAISQQEWENAQREQMENLRQRLGSRFDPKMFESPEMKQRMLDGLVVDRLMQVEARERKLVYPDEALARDITSNAAFFGEDGKFSKDIFNQRVTQIGMTPKIFEERMRESKINGYLQAALQGSAILPRSVAARLSDISEQEREVQEVLIKADDYAAKVKITDEMVKDYYNKNSKKFEMPEMVKLEYVVLNNAIVEAQLVVDDAAAKKAYDQNQARYKEEEQRRASHILIKLEKNASKEAKEAARAKINDILVKARANKDSFAALAKEHSQDGSAAQGGDLDFFGPGNMVKAFEDVAFRLQKGDISDVVETEFGFHIIMLTDIKPQRVKPFEEVKNDIVAELKRAQSNKKYSELAEIFNNTVEEQEAGLKAVAEHSKLKLQIQTATDVVNVPNPSAGIAVPHSNPKFLKAIFENPEVLKGKRNSEVIDLGQNTLVAAHVTEYKPAKVRPLEEVLPAIKAFLLQTESLKMAKADGVAKIAALKARDDVTAFGEVKTVARGKPPTINQVAMQEVMKADTAKLPAFVGVELPGVGYGVYRIGKVVQPTTQDAARRKSEAEQIAGILAQQDTFASVEYLKEKNKVKISKLASPAASASAAASADAASAASSK